MLVGSTKHETNGQIICKRNKYLATMIEILQTMLFDRGLQMEWSIVSNLVHIRSLCICPKPGTHRVMLHNEWCLTKTSNKGDCDGMPPVTLPEPFLELDVHRRTKQKATSRVYVASHETAVSYVSRWWCHLVLSFWSSEKCLPLSSDAMKTDPEHFSSSSGF